MTASTVSTGTTAMQFEKRNFMGIELDVLTGHPEHDLLFVATQVARAAGLKDPHNQVSLAAAKLGALRVASIGNLPRDGRIVKANSWLFTEASLYQMLLRGHAPASEPFRKWVTEEVLPTIRKTGKYDAEQSTNPIAQGVMDELKTLRGEVGELKSLIEILMARPAV
ncbi:BRO-N domain-containing protein, partial [Pseudomonas fildesensis]